ncbi:hypothetical protein KC19_6G128300 [Ceratodon purpureus]|uniref:BRO1 domain-containing protein n=1 Tax=Ceratodon purpureus TaxID=3225 RepID=A0A8T0HGY3_CERPU|nr:hypothetical protein KC19_6G128300 [Ceratodon purpureus]
MGCIFSSDAIDDGGIVEVSFLSGEVYVFVPGLREPTQNDLTELLKGSVSAGMASKLQSLRSQVIAASSGRNEPGLKLKRSKSQDGDPGGLDLENALKNYLPVLLGLVTGGEKFTTAIEYPWTNVEDERKETALASGYYELLSVLHLLGMLALQEANACLTPRPPVDAFDIPKASEGMCFALHPVFTFGRYISASLTWYKLSDGNSYWLCHYPHCNCSRFIFISGSKVLKPSTISSAIGLQRDNVLLRFQICQFDMFCSCHSLELFGFVRDFGLGIEMEIVALRNVILTGRVFPTENKRNAIEILLKAASYFECAINAVLPNTPDEIKAKLPVDLTEEMLRSLEQQALGQAVELQLGFAIDNVKASLAVKRRLACEQVEVWEQAIEKLASTTKAATMMNKHILFVKWKLAEAKAAAYYFHGLILNEGYEANTHAESLSCLKAANAHLKESQKARTEFSNMEPFTKVPSLWGPMKFLTERIPREVVSKNRIFRDNYTKEKFPASTPKLPEFPIALEADPYRLPPVDPAWKKEHGFEARPSITPDVPIFLAKKNHSPTRSPFSDMRRAGTLAPPMRLSEMVVGAR